MVYKKKVSTKDPRFSGRAVEMFAGIGKHHIPVPDTVVLCNGCNQNIYPEDGYLIYLGKREVQKDLPYDFYCPVCTDDCFPKAIEVLMPE